METIKALLLICAPIWLGYLLGVSVTNDPDARMVIAILAGLIIAFGIEKQMKYQRNLNNIRNERNVD
jgi:hypothetical protein